MNIREAIAAVLAFIVGALVMTLLMDRVFKIEIRHNINWPVKAKVP